MHISRLFHGLFSSSDKTDKSASSASDAHKSTRERLPQADAEPVRHSGPGPRGHLSRHQLIRTGGRGTAPSTPHRHASRTVDPHDARHAAASLSEHPHAVAQIADQEQQITRLAARPDAHCFEGELREIRDRIAQARAMGSAADGGWHRARVLLGGSQTWLARLSSELKQIDRLPDGWRSLVTDRRALSPVARAAVERRAFRVARLMCAERCDAREATAMARRAEASIASGCPETSALMNERVRRALMRKHPAGIVDPLTRMLRMNGPAIYSDALAVLRVMTRLPAQMAEQLADAGVTIVPAPGRLSNVRPEELLGPGDIAPHGHYDHDKRTLTLLTRHHPGAGGGRAFLPKRLTPLHEAAHAYDHLIGTQTHADTAFLAARERDLASGHIRPGRDDYFREVDAELDSNPRRETFAESLAHYLIGDRRWPALHAYWDEKLRGKASGDPSSRA